MRNRFKLMTKATAFLLVCLLVLLDWPGSAVRADDADSATPPIASGVVNTVTYIRWGKSELFPVLAMVGPGTELDVYEYDQTWVLVLYETMVTQGSQAYAHAFYGYMKRSAITCDPELEGDASDKADTGPGKRKGRKPRTNTETSAGTGETQPTASGPSDQTVATEPEQTVERDDEGYDWIIRTPGLCNVTIQVDEAVFTCSFALMAQKVGGLGPSSDPAYNHGIRTPYAATAFFGMFATMQDMLENMGAAGFLHGSGGIEITGQAGGAVFYIDTASIDPALVNFTITIDATGVFNPSITDGQITVDAGTTTVSQPFPLPVQLKKSGGGYIFVLPGLRPGGGDLEFPAVLEKTFTDPDQWDKEARDADKRRAEAEKLRKKMLEKLKKQIQDEYNRQQQENSGNDTESTTADPMNVTNDQGEDIDLAPLTPVTEEIPLETLVPATDSGPDPLASLVPEPGEAVEDFPDRQP